jgi:hypothetical protein
VARQYTDAARDVDEEEDEETYILMWDSTPTSCAPARKVRVV